MVRWKHRSGRVSPQDAFAGAAAGDYVDVYLADTSEVIRSQPRISPIMPDTTSNPNATRRISASKSKIGGKIEVVEEPDPSR